MNFDLIVIGAGAAGMMCAATAGKRGRRVLLIEHAEKLAEKIRISGGGRCNFTNLDCRPANFLSRNPDFCRSALSRYTQHDFITLVERHGIRHHEKTLGQLFCDDSAELIIAMLKRECDDAGVNWAMPASVEGVARGSGGGFAIATSKGGFSSNSLVIATGGLSIPKLGATPFGYRIAEQFGVPVIAPKPALVPLAAPPEWLAQFGELSGASFDTIADCDADEQANAAGPARKPSRRKAGQTSSPRFREAALITHRGLSGPAILQISSYWQFHGARRPITLDLLPAMNDEGAVAEWLLQNRGAGQSPGALLAAHLPKRFAMSLAAAQGWTEPLADMSRASIDGMARTLKAWRIQPAGTLGYAKAEVTLGGVDTDALSQQTMAVRSVPGLYFIGEVVDVTGWLGGYNFQWAWSSGYAAGVAA
jgi:predicted Rossmann fold flavoprotein